ncbi:MAG: hypothetical protein JWL70_2041, partial [Acidimicrobiia bacterium]|nr:hypothetical protein [Acidimicrobiia bacterium]
MIILAVALLMLAPAVFDLCGRPVLRRLALRNLSHRPMEALLVVLGSLLGTAIITASLVVGDTLDASVRDIARVSQGPIDEQARVIGSDNLGPLESALRRSTIPHTDGLLPAVWAPVAVATPGAQRRAEPKAVVVEVDFDAARRFGGDAEATGLAGAGATPRPGEAVIASDLAQRLHVRAGDPMEVFAYGTSLTVAVRQVVPNLGIAGWGRHGTRASTVFLAPGALAALSARASGGTSAPAAATPPNAVVWVSNVGGVFSGVQYSREVSLAIAARVASVPGTEVTQVKHDTLDDAERAGRNFTDLFSSIGSFAVIAGVLLLVNIFVMLSEERKRELGILRAVGLKRWQLVRSFGAEGSIYAVAASFIGALVGLGVGALIAVATRGLTSGSNSRVSIRFAANGTTIRDGLCAGLVIALATVWLTSARLASLNVIRAIRDLPEPPRRSVGHRASFGLTAVLVGGIGLTVAGFHGSQSALLLGPSLMITGGAWLASIRWSPRMPTTVGAMAVLAWCIGSVWVVRSRMRDAPLSTFVVDGLILVAASVVALVVNADLWAAALTRGRAVLTARLAAAYPLA